MPFDPTVTPQAIVALISLTISVVLGLLSRKILYKIQDSLSTKYLGGFPDYLDDLIALVSRARKKLVIVCDHPAYGAITHPNAADRYRAEIQAAAARGVDIQCMFLTQQGSAAALRRQFLLAMTTEQDEQRKVPQHLVNTLIEQLRPYVAAPITASQINSYHEFIRLIVQLNEELRRALFSHRRISVERIGGPMQLHFWIADGREAIFSIPNNTADDDEQAFHTGDHSLIGSLLSTAKRYSTEAIDGQDQKPSNA